MPQKTRETARNQNEARSKPFARVFLKRDLEPLKEFLLGRISLNACY